MARVDSLLNLPDVRALFPRRFEFRWSAAPTVSVGAKSYRPLYVLEDRPIVTGSNLVDAKEDIDPLTSGPIVTFELDRKGARDFGEGTGRNVGNYMAILLDDRVQGRPPVIQERIERRGQITLSGKTFQEAQDLALTLRAGALPVPLKIVEERRSAPAWARIRSAGACWPGLVGTGLVILIMIGIYRMSGVLAVVALGLYILFSLGALAMLGATLTLPGLAGLILSVGIAVDANVLIFERIREELALGKTVRLVDRRGLQARHERDRRLQRHHGHDRAVPVPVRHRAGQGLRGDADDRHHRLDDHRGLRDPDLLHDLAGQAAGHANAEHLT